jgi:antitoxin component YwqK of YwqJK toxin-antitoxin module
MTAADLNIAEITHDSGAVKCRYGRYIADDGKRWIRHGLFRAYHEDGKLASEGHYEHGVEHGWWRDFHENGQLAAEGQYDSGQEMAGTWRYWNSDGVVQNDD